MHDVFSQPATIGWILRTCMRMGGGILILFCSAIIFTTVLVSELPSHSTTIILRLLLLGVIIGFVEVVGAHFIPG